MPKIQNTLQIQYESENIKEFRKNNTHVSNSSEIEELIKLIRRKPKPNVNPRLAQVRILHGRSIRLNKRKHTKTYVSSKNKSINTDRNENVKPESIIKRRNNKTISNKDLNLINLKIFNLKNQQKKIWQEKIKIQDIKQVTPKQVIQKQVIQKQVIQEQVIQKQIELEKKIRERHQQELKIKKERLEKYYQEENEKIERQIIELERICKQKIKERKQRETYEKKIKIKRTLFNYNLNEKNLSIKSSYNIKIYYVSKYIKTLSVIFYEYLKKIKNINCSLHHLNEINIEEQQESNTYYFILGFSALNLKLPEGLKYFLYQLEQTNTPEKLKPIMNNLKLIENSILTFDYNEENIEYYPNYVKHKIRLLHPPIENYQSYYEERKYDVLFFGTQNERRNNIIQVLKKHFNVCYVNNIFDEPLDKLICQSFVCLNLHYYKDAVLETSRIHKLLNKNVTIISETTNETKLLQYYKDHVSFIDIINDDLSNVNNLVEEIKYSLLIHSPKSKTPIMRSIQNNTETQLSSLIFWLIIEQNKELFHKYYLGLKQTNENIEYTITHNNYSEEFKENQYYSHLHCYDLSNFYYVYTKQDIDIICKTFKIIITYSIITNDAPILPSEFVILKIKNKGNDIGGKFNVVKYLHDNMIYYRYIFFLQSKTDYNQRRAYFNPLLNLINKYDFKTIKKYDGYFQKELTWNISNPQNTYNSTMSNDKNTWPERNNIYRNSILNLCSATNNTTTFVEGNVYILSNKVIQKLFTNVHLYNNLNGEESFDYNFEIQAYKNTINNAMNSFEYPNKLKIAYENYNRRVLNKVDLNLKRHDGCLEHAFERCVLNFCKSYLFV